MEFLARQDCVIAGHPGIVRTGDRIALSPRAAKYPRLKGWIEPAPELEPPAPVAPNPDPRPRRSRRAQNRG